MRGPQAFADHLDQHFYHPRSDAHSNALCLGVLDDLLRHCAPLAEKAARGEVVAQLNHTVTVSFQNWNIDLAVGPPPGAPLPPENGAPISFAAPAVVEVALEAKGVMTEHGKARRNRLRDLQAFHSHAHSYNQNVIAVGMVVVNASAVFWSPTRAETDVTEHRNIDRLAAETVDLFRNLPLRNAASAGPGLEAAAVLVVKHDNLRKNPNLPADAPASSDTVLVTKPPAPQTGDPLHYATMIQRVCTAYRERRA
ncbi:MAG: hypothetical protein ACR2GR_10125 [Rhodothermales bacterium]